MCDTSREEGNAKKVVIAEESKNLFICVGEKIREFLIGEEHYPWAA